MRETTWLRALAGVVFGVTLVALQSCGGDGTVLPVLPPSVASIDISPGSASVDPQASVAYTAVARAADGSPIKGVAFTWSSSDTTVATIDGSGVATGLAPGTTQITAAAAGVQSQPATLIALNIVTAPPPGTPTVLSGDVEGATERETSLAATLIPSSPAEYHFTFGDPYTRSVMFHNTFRANRMNGEAVTVRAFYRVEGSSAWIEEDWSEYEWIGFCRDFKAQRLSDLRVVATADASANVVASGAPRLMRNVVGCWAFTGSARRAGAAASWGPGQGIWIAASVIFDLNPGGYPNQYSSQAEGRLRVPIAAPLFRQASWVFNEAYMESGCAYQFTAARDDETSLVLGGTGFGTIMINNFIDSLPASVRQQLVSLNGATSLAYTADGGSSVSNIPTGTITGPQPECGTSYLSTPGLWLLTGDGTNAPPVIDRLDGTLSGTFHTGTTEVDIVKFEWSLSPQRQP